MRCSLTTSSATTDAPPANGIGTELFGRAVDSSARLAANFFTDTPFSGQFNLLTTSSFDTPQQLFSADSFARSVAYVSVGAPVGDHADWTVRGAMTQGDICVVDRCGRIRRRARPRVIATTSVCRTATQRYDGGNPPALQRRDRRQP